MSAFELVFDISVSEIVQTYNINMEAVCCLFSYKKYLFLWSYSPIVQKEMIYHKRQKFWKNTSNKFYVFLQRIFILLKKNQT